MHYSLEYRPVCCILTVETSLLLASEYIPYNNGLRFISHVNQWAECHKVSENKTNIKHIVQDSERRIICSVKYFPLK